MFTYRGIDKSTKKWVAGFYCPVSFGRFPCRPAIVPPSESCWQPFEIIPETLGVGWGAKDKNNKEIFTGDYVIDKDTNMFGKVDFEQGSFGFIDEVEQAFQLVSSSEWESFEVVGNVYEETVETILERIFPNNNKE